MSEDARETTRARSADVLTFDDAKIHALPPHGVIVVRVPDGDQDGPFSTLATRLAMVGRDDVTVIAVAPGVELDVLDADEMRAAGWVRRE